MTTVSTRRGQSRGEKDMWKHVAVSASFWPPLELSPSSTLSWPSVAPRRLDMLDKVNLKLILVSFQDAH